MDEQIKKEMEDMGLPIPNEILNKVYDQDLIKEMQEFIEKPVDRFGNCPHCKKSWEGEDIFQHISQMDIYINKSKTEVEKVAEQYGWTPENRKKFSLVLTQEITFTPLLKLTYLKCPYCLHVFEAATGKHYNSITEAKNSIYE